MKYVQVPRPEKHNGGAFYEHEIHIDLAQNDYSMEKRVKAFMDQSPDQKHTDYRVGIRLRNEPWKPGEKPTLYMTKSFKTVRTVAVRFQDKNKALLFKLSFQP